MRHSHLPKTRAGIQGQNTTRCVLWVGSHLRPLKLPISKGSSANVREEKVSFRTHFGNAMPTLGLSVGSGFLKPRSGFAKQAAL